MFRNTSCYDLRITSKSRVDELLVWLSINWITILEEKKSAFDYRKYASLCMCMCMSGQTSTTHQLNQITENYFLE